MKKIILLFAVCFACGVHAQNALTSKIIEADSVTGLNQRIEIFQLTINSDAQIVIIEYRIATLSPNGKVVSVSPSKTYTRSGGNWTTLYNSPTGQAILRMLAADLVPIESVKDLKLLEQ